MRNDTQFCGVEFRRAELNWASVWGRRRVGAALSFSQSESHEETEVTQNWRTGGICLVVPPEIKGPEQRWTCILQT